MRLTPFKLASEHVFKELLLTFIICLGSLLTLILIGRMLQLKELFLGQSLGVMEIGRLFFYLSPFFLQLLMPISCMLAIFLTFLRISSDRELIALKAGGVSLYKLLPSPVLFCCLCCVANLAVAFWGISWGMDNFRAEVLEFARNRTQIMIQPGTFNSDFPGLTIFAEQYDPGNKEMRLIFVQDSRGDETSATIVAEKGRVVTDKERGRLQFLLNDGAIYRTAKDQVHTLKFVSYLVNLDIWKTFNAEQLSETRPREMSIMNLRRLAADPDLAKKRDEDYVRKVNVEIQKRYTLPVACLVLGLFALPFACSFQGVKQYVGVLMALGMFIVYYSLYSISISLGESGFLAPWIGLWLPNGIFFVSAIFGIRLTAQEKSIRLGDWLTNMRMPFRKKSS
ncbi:LPS export ABC transporter permease LptF [Desulfocurvibacter africanus]